jgi:hypothetical protein
MQWIIILSALPAVLFVYVLRPTLSLHDDVSWKAANKQFYLDFVRPSCAVVICKERGKI